METRIGEERISCKMLENVQKCGQKRIIEKL